jgi:chloride channel protein, CIC family
MRRPEPLVKQRMPSGRGATEQPNITSGGACVLTPRFWVMVVLAGVAAGLLGALMMAILFNVQYAAFGYHEGSLQHGVEHAPAARRVASLLIAGVFGGVAWFLLRRYTTGEPSLLAGPVIGLVSAGYIGSSAGSPITAPGARGPCSRR